MSKIRTARRHELQERTDGHHLGIYDERVRGKGALKLSRKSPLPRQVVAICGKNEKMVEKLKSQKYPDGVSVAVRGFTSAMSRKPGAGKRFQICGGEMRDSQE